MHRLGIVAIVLMLWPTVAMAQATPAATPEWEPEAGCRLLGRYGAVMVSIRPTIDAETHIALDRIADRTFSELASVPSHHLTTVAEYLDQYVAKLEAVDLIPRIVQPLHDAYVERVVLISHLMRANARGDLISAIGYLELLDENQDSTEAIVIDMQLACGPYWWRLAFRQPSVYPFFWPGWQGA